MLLKEFDGALESFEGANRIVGKRYGADHIRLVKNLKGIARIHEQRGDAKQAKQNFDFALAIQKSFHGECSAEVIETLEELGAVADEKESYAQRVAQLRANLAAGHHNRGVSLQQSGEFEKALAQFSRALQLKDQLFGAYSEQSVATLEGIAATYDSLGEYALAEELFAKLLAEKERLFGAASTEYALTLENLSILHQNKRDFVQALKYGQRALEIRLNAQGAADSLEVARSQSNLAILLEQVGEFDKAFELLTAAHEKELRLFGNQHHAETSVTLFNLALVQSKRGRLPEAATALAECEKLLDRHSKQGQNLFARVESLRAQISEQQRV